ncbi:hypothetical protein [Pseudogemmobacter bohemicus]|uniref:hypothetical protein n=1 Tax=Pseudogemmobacter bohemicus TaxID=2250708 RepID=UPI0013001D74|nr:hypothetical protein [Pseudogemmobacter bohemicus]
MKYVIGILVALLLLPKLANGTGTGMFGYYSSLDTTAIFRQAAPYVAAATGILLFVLLRQGARRSATSPGTTHVKTRVLVISIVVAIASAWMITSHSAPILLSAFGSSGTSQTVSVMRAAGNVPCKTAYSIRRDVPSSERPGLICVPKALDQHIASSAEGMTGLS